MASTGDASMQLAQHPDMTISSPMPASLQAAAAGLNEEDAKLLASLAEGNGLLSHLSNLAAQNASSDQLIHAYGGLMLDSSSGLPSTDPAFDAAQQAFQGAVDLNEALTRQDMDWDDEAFDDLEPEDEDDQDQGPIQAYAKLEFPGFSYYIQTLDVTIGRRPGQLQPNQLPGALPPQLPNAASGLSQAHITSESKTEGDVDVDLGPLKSISRLHARIFYYTGPVHPPPNAAFVNGNPAHSRSSSGNGAGTYRITSPTALSRVSGSHLAGADGVAQDPYNIASRMGAVPGTDPEQGEGQFVLMVMGRNGAFVDDVWVEKGGLVVLGKRTKIQIAERVFYFVLPPPPGAASYSIDGDSQRAHNSESESLSDLSSDDQEDDDDDKDDEDEDEDDEEEDEEEGSVSASSGGEDEYEGQDGTKGRRRSSAAGGRGKLDPARRDAKPKRRLVLKPKSKVGKASDSAAADDSDDEALEEQSKTTSRRGKASAKTTAAALANRAAGKGKGKGAGQGKMPTKGPVPDTRPDGDDSDSLGTPSAGEQSSEVEEEEEDDDGIVTPPPSNRRGSTAGKRPTKGVKGQKAAKGAKAGRAKGAEPDGIGEAAGVKKESPTPAWAMGAGIAGRKRKRGEAASEEEPALKVGTPIGIEALDAAKRTKAAKARADASARITSVSPKKGKATPTTSAASASTTAATASADDDVVMVDVKPATTTSASSSAAAPSSKAAFAPIAPAVASNSATAAMPAATTTASAPAGPASKVGQKTTEKTASAPSAAAKAKPAKAKPAKPKKKKGAAEEVSPTPSGLAGTPGSTVPGTPVGPSTMPMGAFPGSFAGQNLPPTSMPYDPSSASAASAIIAAAHAVSGSIPGYGSASAQMLPNAAGPMASTLPMIPTAATGKAGPSASGANAYGSTSATTSLPAPNSTPGPASTASTSGSDPSTWPTTASIIASAASLANAQAKQSQKPAAAGVGGTTPSTASAVPTASLAPAPAAPKPPPGPEDKPDLTNVELISQALRSDHCTKKNGKLTLQEVYEWIANKWVWFKRNGRHTGRDWQSSIRHAIGSTREFTRIPRRSDEPGKGIFYTMSDSKVAEQHRANLAKQKEEAAKAAAAGPPAPVGAAGVPSANTPGGTTAVGPKPGASATTATANPASAAAAVGAAATAAAGTPGSLPAIRIPLIIGTPPSSAAAAAADKPKAAPGTIESLLETPPIVHHDGKLYLSPQVFGHLNAGQLAQIEGLGAQQALQVLQAYLVTHLKERMKQQQVAAQSKTASPAGPTPAANVKPASTTSAAAGKATPAPSPAPAASVSTTTAGANGTASPANKAVSATTALPKPPVSATSLHSMTTLPKPVLPTPVKPAVAGSSQSATASAKVNTPGTAAGSTGSPATAQSTSNASAPAKAPVLPSTPIRPSVPATTAATKASTPAPASAVTNLAASPAKPSAVTPVASGSAPQKSGSPVKPTAASEANGAGKPTSSSTAAASDAAGPSASPAPAATDSDDPLSALSALAAHPEAAALIALLRKQQQESGASGGKQLAKLTPGQLQLLQMANKLAAQQGKKGGSGKKKKKASTGAGTREGTATPGPGESSPAPAGPSPSPGPKVG
ncbi:Transcription factor, fork head [Kalmanozyma brasiliensis GHG001]|uniref:Fork-head domain-containing protein n=1 Tax=Kalmanozyma brasiliensis (strain GHG001) TaxID=1365824 RepID=V5EUU3_KALBG|nr:Transcription factor, fork head [Kalmanozyma brasiliensis GHG001]EST09160.1 Transcription factor, fork head [Kalmanozyma brasiliensis GHG001]